MTIFNGDRLFVRSYCVVFFRILSRRRKHNDIIRMKRCLFLTTFIFSGNGTNMLNVSTSREVVFTGIFLAQGDRKSKVVQMKSTFEKIFILENCCYWCCTYRFQGCFLCIKFQHLPSIFENTSNGC